VIAGHAAPKAKVALTDHGQTVAEASADETGQFALVPPAFAPGAHSLGLTASVGGGKPVESAVAVPIDVPQPPPKAEFKPKLAAAAPPASAKGSAPLAPPSSSPPAPARAPPPPVKVAAAPAPAPSTPAAPTPTPRVAVIGVAVEDAGRLVATGAAPPGAFLRLYLNGSFLANVTAGPDGRWSLTVEHGMKGGAYAVRADEIDQAKDSVIARAEVPFNYPERVADLGSGAKPSTPAPAASPPSVSPAPVASPPAVASTPAPVPTLAPLAPAPKLSASASEPEKTVAAPRPPVPRPEVASSSVVAAASSTDASANMPAPKTTLADAPPAAASPAPASANAIVRDVDTAKVIRGDSLWRISSQHYGNGVRYKQIFAANASQIRDPRLIYPGQIFVLPLPTPF
jgi:nucleoid-associated protein YgaU